MEEDLQFSILKVNFYLFFHYNLHIITENSYNLLKILLKKFFIVQFINNIIFVF